MILSSCVCTFRVSLSRTMQTLSTLERRREESKAGEPQVLMGCGQGEKSKRKAGSHERARRGSKQKRRREDKTRRPSLVQV